MNISLVIPTYNRKDLLRRCLATATSQVYPDYEVIVVDDASTDGTDAMVLQEFPQVCYLRQATNGGPAAARNRGIAAATGEIIAFTDDDCLIPPAFLTCLVAGYMRYTHIAGVGGYLEAPAVLLQHNMFAQYDAYITHHVYGAGSTPYLGGFECPAGGTNSMSYRRDVLVSLGGFDTSFPVAGGEDADLKLRIVRQGKSLLYIPIKVLHNQPYNLQSFWDRNYKHGRGSVYFAQKHAGSLPSSKRLILRAGVRLARWIRTLVLLKPRLATVRLLADMADLAGQWHEIRYLARSARSSQLSE